jgi:hypothetical protein
MHQPIELTLESADGPVDCRIEPNETGERQFYTAVILYPHQVDGLTFSKVYDHELVVDRATGQYQFTDESIHPKIKALESQIAAALSKLGL